MIIPRDRVEKLVRAHASLEEATTAAIWIRPDDAAAWLVEVIPEMTDDDAADEPIVFAPGVSFTFPLALIAGNRGSLEKALRKNRKLAADVASGHVMLDTAGDATHLVELAKELSPAA